MSCTSLSTFYQLTVQPVFPYPADTPNGGDILFTMTSQATPVIAIDLLTRVDSLDPPECRQFIWIDRDYALWYWDSEAQDWYWLEPLVDGYLRGQSVDHPDDDTWWDRPFHAIARNPQYIGGSDDDES